MSKSLKIVELGDNKYDGDWLRSVPEAKAIAVLKSSRPVDQIRNAWKQANGKSVRNHTKSEESTSNKSTRSKSTRKTTKK